jgi:hypothetical protein
MWWDMNVVNSSLVTGMMALAANCCFTEKAGQAGSVAGIDTLILLLLHCYLQGAQERVSKRLGLRGRAIPCPYAEIGMDVDKPHQLEIMRKDLSRRASNSG